MAAPVLSRGLSPIGEESFTGEGEEWQTSSAQQSSTRLPVRDLRVEVVDPATASPREQWQARLGVTEVNAQPSTSHPAQGSVRKRRGGNVQAGSNIGAGNGVRLPHIKPTRYSLGKQALSALQAASQTFSLPSAAVDIDKEIGAPPEVPANARGKSPTRASAVSNPFASLGANKAMGHLASLMGGKTSADMLSGRGSVIASREGSITHSSRGGSPSAQPRPAHPGLAGALQILTNNSQRPGPAPALVPVSSTSTSPQLRGSNGMLAHESSSIAAGAAAGAAVAGGGAGGVTGGVAANGGTPSGLTPGGSGVRIDPVTGLPVPVPPGGAQQQQQPGGDEDEILVEAPDLHLTDDDELTGRILSLPNIMCRAANGDIFLVGLGDVQRMLHKRRLGSKGFNILRRFEHASMSQWDVMQWKERNEMVHLKWRQGHEKRIEKIALTSPLAANVSDSGRGSPGPGGVRSKGSADGALTISVDMDDEVRRHFDTSMAAVETHREYLQKNSVRALAEVERQQQSEAHRKRQAAAVNFVVKTLVPEKFMAMARTRRAGKGAAASSLFRRMKQSLTPEPDPRAKQGHSSPVSELYKMASIDEDEEGHRGSMSGGVAGWGKAAGRVADVFKMPFINEWNIALRKLRKEDATPWDELLVANSVYVKGGAGGETQGTAVYVLKCQELGVIPSTQVVQQLRMADANMAHCKLGRRGAQALRHALSTNTVISTLNLADNGLDAQATAEIIGGLTAGQMARTPKQRKQVNNKWRKLDFMKVKTGPGDLEIPIMPAAVRAKFAEEEGGGSEPPQPSSPSRNGPGSPKRGAAGGPPSPTRASGAAAASGAAGGASFKTPAPVAPSPSKRFSDDMRASPLSNSPSSKPHIPHTGSQKPATSNLIDSILSKVQVLDMSENPMGINGAKVLADLLDPSMTSVQFLVELHANKCGIPEAGGLALFRALARGNSTLRVLSLNNNSIGNKSASALGELLSVNFALQELDISWNKIKPEGVDDLCQGLEVNMGLVKLSLAWNGLEDTGVVRIGQMLMKNNTLKHLDLTNTRMGSEACLMLGEAIKVNHGLEELMLNGNSFGDDGARHLMNALKLNNTLQYLGLQGSNMSSAARGAHGAADFNPLAPDGSYSLLLSNAADRAVALQLCQMEVDSKAELMKNIKLEGRNIGSARAMRWPEQLPVAGMLTFDFVSRRSQKPMPVMDHKKFMALVGQLESRTMSDKERLTLVEVMAPFTYFYCHQVAQVISCFAMGSELVRAAALLFTRAVDLEDSIDVLTAAMQERDIHQLHEELSWYSYTRFSNPTGHYELNLTTTTHQAIAARLKDVAYSEPSDNNNWHNIMHDLYSHTLKVPSNYGPPENWKSSIPTRGTLAFDFVSNVGPPPDAQPITEEELVDFLHHGIGIQFDDSGCPLPELDFQEADLQVALLRQEVGHQFFFLCHQVKRVLECFEYGPHRVEVVVMLYGLIMDPKNFWTITYSLRAFEQALLLWRLGPGNVFDRVHPSGHYVLDLSNPAHEQVARKLVDLAANNPENQNFWNIRLQGYRKNMPEGRNMWGTFTAESFTPWLEFDFLYSDVWETMLNKTKADMEVMGKGDRLDLITKLARRLELQRVKEMYGHFTDGSGWSPPLWRTGGQLWKPLIMKAPWLASWDRLMRLLVRYDLRSGDIQGDSYLEDMFDERCNEEGELASDQFEALCKDWGYTKGEVFYHYKKLFEQASHPSVLEPDSSSGGGAAPGQAGAGRRDQDGPPSALGHSGGFGAAAHALLRGGLQGAGGSSDVGGLLPTAKAPAMVVEFPTFVEIFMREPAPELRWKELPVNNLLVVAAAAKALKGMRRAPGQPGAGAAAAKK